VPTKVKARRLNQEVTEVRDIYPEPISNDKFKLVSKLCATNNNHAFGGFQEQASNATSKFEDGGM
jgi:hypothetical protein